MSHLVAFGFAQWGLMGDRDPVASGRSPRLVTSCPRRRDCSVLRLWKRVGFFRVLSVALLALGLIGGLMIAQSDGQYEEELAAKAAGLAAQAEHDNDIRQLAQDLSVHQDAQGKANEIA